METKPITVITRDNIRTLKPHTNEAAATAAKRGSAVKLNMADLDRVKGASVFMSKEELERYNKEMGLQKIMMAEAAKSRKAKMEEFDHQRSQNAKLSAIEQEAKDKSNYLLAKAHMQLEEQEDAIKHMNELMLYAKCVAIRDAQVDEKKLIARERKEEEARLDAMMESDRVRELKKLEDRDRRRMEEQRRGAAKIREQIDERKEAALLEQEKRDQETKQILATIQKMAEEDKVEKEKKFRIQKGLMQEVAQANLNSMDRRKQIKKEEEEEDKKVLDYLLEKERRELENDKIQMAKKAERELELARLRAAQEKASDKQAQQDALRAQRAYEAYERDWRRKEKEAAEKHAAMERDLKSQRIEQQRAREHAVAVEARKLKEEFIDNLRGQREAEERIKAEERERHERNRAYALEVKQQIKEKEIGRRKVREEFFKEGIRQGVERREKRDKIGQIQERKLQELRAIGVPEKYCIEIERKMHPSDKHMFSMGARQ
ncbi:Cilia- and flagella-associated protein 45 [Irineochytrium annulatum]|nr:Cilia- and flagella-associated protein 45 [Irineochytrium annulatum]